MRQNVIRRNNMRQHDIETTQENMIQKEIKGDNKRQTEKKET